MHSVDYLGFISNLVNCLKLGRNTSFDNENKIPDQFMHFKKLDSYAEEGQGRGIVLIMDNASIH